MEIGPYRIIRPIGEGGAGLVFEARSPDGRSVAVKVLRQGAAASAEKAKGRFEREARLLGDLGQGQGFVPLLDAGEARDGPYIVMPLLRGGTLRERLRGGMNPSQVHELGVFLAGTLAHAHARGVVHRDLKPENILYTEPGAEGRPLVADLGLAKHFSKEASGASRSVSLSRGGDMRGTAGYMAPEQMQDSKTVGPPADVFAIGAILYECLAGAPAFEADNLFAILERVENGRHVPLATARPDAPRSLSLVIERALSVDPAERYGDGAALLAALRAPGAPRRRSLRVPVLVLLGTAVLVVSLAVALSLGAIGGRRTPEGTAVVVPHAKDDAGPASEPSWFLAIPERERPKLPPGVRATATPGEFRNEKDGTILVRVPGGDCRLGMKGERFASLKGFLISKLEITNAQFERFVAATHRVTSAEESGGGFISKLRDTDDPNEILSGYDTVRGLSWRDPDGKGRPAADEPVIQVSWLDASAYCEWAGLALPTVDQWEKAASWDPVAKRARRFPWGDEKVSVDSPRFANLADKAFRKKYDRVTDPMYDDGVADRAPVGSFPLDRAPCGALDMGGNVSEWCRGDAPRSGEISVRPYRGGNWCSVREWAQCAYPVDPAPEGTSGNWIGFRPILESKGER